MDMHGAIREASTTVESPMEVDVDVDWPDSAAVVSSVQSQQCQIAVIHQNLP